MKDLDAVHELWMEFETPHTDWCAPNAQGKASILFFGEGRGTHGREVVELMQRFDVDAVAVFYDHIPVVPEKADWVGYEEGYSRIRRLLEDSYDCYVFHAVDPSKLPSDALETVADRVSGGAGVVLAGVEDPQSLTPEVPLDPLPRFLEGAVEPGGAYAVGKGRGVQLPPRPQIPYYLGWETEYDYWQERLGRAMLWATGREPRVHLEAVAPVVLEPSGTERAVTVHWERANAPLTLAARCRRRDGEILTLEEREVGEANGESAIELPASLRADEYFFEVWASSDAGIEAWTTTPFSVASPLRIASLDLVQDWGEIGASVAGTVALTEELTENQTLEVGLVDRRNRVLVRAPVAVETRRGSFEFPIEPWMPMLLRVEATVVESGHEVASRHEFFRVIKRHRDQWNFLVWDFPRGQLGTTLAPYAEESMARLGTTLHLCGKSPPLESAAADIAWVAETTRITAPHDDDGIMQPTCWNDEAKVDAWVRELVQAQRPARGHGVYAYTLGDETVTLGGCRHPACLEAYREYLQQEYDGDIDALNRAWGSDHQSFSEIAMAGTADAELFAGQVPELRGRTPLVASMKSTEFASGNYARWYDRQSFFAANFVNLCRRFDAALKEMDPQALTGFEGGGRMDDADDIDLIARHNGFWSPYPGPEDEIVRSIVAPDFPRSNWMGYALEADFLLGRYWRMVTRGMTSVWWWRWDNISRWHGLLAPHLGPFPAVREVMEDTRAVRDGLGTLLMRSAMLDDGIAILYSHASAHATRIPPGESYGALDESFRFWAHGDNHVSWHNAIRELGLQFRYVTDRMLREGEFDPARFKVLVLPQTEAIGPEEAEILRQFVSQGGTLIADVRPGLYDGHCSPAEAGALDELFGIERIANDPAVTADVLVDCSLDGASISLGLAGARVDPGISAAGAIPLASAGDIPVLLNHEVGSGRAILLNLSMASLPDAGAATTSESVADLWRQLLAQAGVRPRFALECDGARARGIELVRWQNRDITFVALYPYLRLEAKNLRPREVEHDSLGTEVALTLPEAAHVYQLSGLADPDADQGTATDRITTTVRPGRASFFALSPTPISDAEITLESDRVGPGEVATARLRIPGADGLHALRLRATTAAQLEADWLNQVVVVDGEGTDVALPIALNDPTGHWTIAAVDLYSGKEVTAELEVS